MHSVIMCSDDTVNDITVRNGVIGQSISHGVFDV